MRKKRVVFDNNEIYIDERKPSVNNLIPCDLRENSTHEIIRWLIQYPFGYKVYTLRKKEKEGEGQEIAYCFISNAGNYRYPFVKKNEIIVGPYYVAPQYRGNQYAAKLISICLKCYPGQTAWDFIQHNNIASICSTEKAGFKYICDAKYSNKLRILQPCKESEIGDMKLYSK